MSPSDFSDIQNRLPFVLTTEDIGQYNLTYVGKQKVDELQTYVFDVAPKVLEKGKRYFQGKIWVDQTDLQIVVTSGKNVPDDRRKGHEDLSPPFTTYREQVDGKYWFPTYTKADGVLHFGGCKGCMTNDVHLRQIVKYTDYKQFGSKIKLSFRGRTLPTTVSLRRMEHPHLPSRMPSRVRMRNQSSVRHPEPLASIRLSHAVEMCMNRGLQTLRERGLKLFVQPV